MDNISQQSDEMEALSAIYDDQWQYNKALNFYSMDITPNVKLQITLPPSYPSCAPPLYELYAPNMTGVQRERVATEFVNIFKENVGSPIIYQWIEKLKELVVHEVIDTQIDKSPNESKAHSTKSATDLPTFNVIHGPTIQDRKSVFQGHACRVNSAEEVRQVMDYLMQNKKVANATHNILAYRIRLPKGVLLQDCDDDGENHASGRVLHLLDILNVTNVMVVVSRWYGGIQLGPDRFKHINNAARQVLVEAGFIS